MRVFFIFLFLFIIAKELQTQLNKVMTIESKESGHVTSQAKINRETVDSHKKRTWSRYIRGDTCVTTEWV